MDFRLRVFVAVAGNLSFTKAAKELDISQPAITKHIQELEKIYGIRLFERSGGKIVLTRQGEIFLVHARKILEGYDQLMDQMRLISDTSEGQLRIGAGPPFVKSLFSNLFADFTYCFPAVRLSFTLVNRQNVEEALLNGEIDLAIVESAEQVIDNTSAMAVHQIEPIALKVAGNGCDMSVEYKFVSLADNSATISKFMDFVGRWLKNHRSSVSCSQNP